MGWEPILAELGQQRQQLDRLAENSSTGPDRSFSIFCARGCGSCCSLAVNCSFPEAVAIARSLTPAQRQRLKEKIPLLRKISRQAEDLKQYLRQFRSQLGSCPFQSCEDDSCTIYPSRPFSCRALLSTRNSSWCGVDFADLHPQEKTAFLSSLDPQVVAFPSHYLAAAQELGMALETSCLTAMQEAFGVAISGNLLYQLWLELEYTLSDRVADGSAAVRTLLAEGHDLPFLLQVKSIDGLT